MRSIRQSVSLETVIFALAAVTLASGAALGQVEPPNPVAQAQPEPPTNRFGMPLEGWALVRYSVLADGSTTNISIIDRMPATLPERDLRDAVEAWTFEPATRDGDPVDWHNGESAIVFDIEATPAEPTPMFLRGYQQVQAMIDAGEHEDALERSERLIGMEASRLVEMGVGLVQNASINMALENYSEAYAAIERATDPRLTLLDPSELAVPLEYRNRLELRLGDMVGALETFARRQALGPVPDGDLMASSVDRIETGLDGEAAIAVRGKILEEIWMHELERRTFAIGDLEGSLRQVELACDLGSAEFEFSDETEWGVPDSWGECTVTVSGRRDTEFTLYEFQ